MAWCKLARRLYASTNEIYPTHTVHIPTAIPLSVQEVHQLISRGKGTPLHSPIQKFYGTLYNVIQNGYCQHFKHYSSTWQDIHRLYSSTFGLINHYSKINGYSLNSSGKKLLNICDNNDPVELSIFGNGVCINDDGLTGGGKESIIGASCAHNTAEFINEDGIKTNIDKNVVYKSSGIDVLFYDGSGQFTKTGLKTLHFDEDRDLTVFRLNDKLIGSTFMNISKTNKDSTYSERAVCWGVNGGQGNQRSSLGPNEQISKQECIDLYGPPGSRCLLGVEYEFAEGSMTEYFKKMRLYNREPKSVIFPDPEGNPDMFAHILPTLTSWSGVPIMADSGQLYGIQIADNNVTLSDGTKFVQCQIGTKLYYDELEQFFK